jgi:ureidoglycolate lyase
MIPLPVAPLTAEGFAPWGDVIEARGTPDRLINQGLCGRFHDLARLDFGDGRAGLSLFDAEARHLPHVVDMVERHPDGSQAFIPVSGVPFLVIVAEDAGGVPVRLRAFVTAPGQSVNLLRGVWHGVLAPLGSRGQFVVLDRIGDGPNLQEHWFDTPYVIDPVPDFRGTPAT